ncbi:MAG: hypothetical protein HYX21_00065 [Candidatus Yanofskybacteria bacterium]|nr:hypothetical protein [Candidatus Yanofskybacteria bacterium]
MDNFQVTPLSGSVMNQKFKSKKRWAKWLFFFSVFLVVVGAIFFFLGRSSFSESKVEFDIEAPAEISSGEEVVYKVKYANRNEISLRDLKLAFFYPDDSVVIKNGVRREFLTENLRLDDLGPNQEAVVEFSAYVVGSRGDVKKAKATLVYSPEGVQSTFQKESERGTNIATLPVSLTLVSPPNTVSGQEISYILDYRNESQEDLSDLKLKFSYPDSFTVTRLSPAPSLAKDIWEIKRLKPDEGQRITISGILRGAERESKQVSVILQRKVDGIFIDYEKAVSTTTISTPPLATKILINGKTEHTAQIGEELNYQIKFSNNTDENLLGLTISAKLEGSMFDFSSLQSEGFFDGVAKTITWNASVSPLLNRLSSGQEGAVNFRLKLKDSFPGGSLGAKNFVVKVSSRTETSTVPSGFDLDRLVAESETTTKVSSIPVLVQSGLYRDQDFGATGPMPPKAGNKTFYTIVWEISNSSNDFSKVRVKGLLPVGVNWENKTRVNGQQSLPALKSNSQEVVWDIGSLPSGLGGQFPKYQAWFQVSFTPSQLNVGSAISLLKNISLEGEDSFTRQAILVKVNDITSNDLTDFPGQGSVVE